MCPSLHRQPAPAQPFAPGPGSGGRSLHPRCRRAFRRGKVSAADLEPPRAWRFLFL